MGRRTSKKVKVNDGEEKKCDVGEVLSLGVAGAQPSFSRPCSGPWEEYGLEENGDARGEVPCM